ncbi:MAG TPA: Tim44/TimA family putative adaptor protein [Dongiaceae bacterium]|jgi:predicted lipid-binding transport protein (Tim44 family)|nr:Tim44/TimA family putative adaptor protein [Dongiaceae bacterium]
MAIDIVFFALLALFLGWRLYSVLGQRVGAMQTTQTPRTAAPKIFPPRRRKAVIAESAQPGIAALQQAEPDFDPDHFLEGANIAYETIVTAFAQGNRAAFRPLLDDATYAHFCAVIDEREANGQRVEFHLIGISRSEIVACAREDTMARIEVTFTSQHIQAIYDRAGTLVSGDAKQIEIADDHWSFARPLNAKDPNWRVVATH